ncbi:C4-dicarboxylate ABC transporter substrate-binding protein [Acuticoccus sediminis]|uniref:C4-dicarboxylate ABC transporter substrate-binding protein n=1 Tax=Acuticoccus sediminis TaxID=2184697 RepID=A0A8B2NPQ3_9HYPH|nr:TRAP transporter substrate-binding protein [Acuticoccus sediminis]RAI01866.1 C4-dicarboxylate ABC transporter substrate-binding protein [Acuticoccus sediminis]
MPEPTFAVSRLGAAVLASVLAATVPAAAEQWDMPTAYGAGNFITQAYVAFADDVRERTGGEIDITVHPGGSLYGGSEILRAVREGQVPIGARFLGAHSAEAPIFGLDTVPFLATNAAEARALYEASRPALDAALEERGLKLLFAPIWPPQGLFVNTEVTRIEDMQGKRFRAYDPSTTRLAELMGAVPTRTEASEIAQAFSTGMAESMMASGAIGVFQKIWDYVDYFYLVNAWLPKSVVLVNLDTWNGLDEATQTALMEAGAKAEAAVWEEMETVNQGYIDTMREAGMTVEEPSDALAASLKSIGDTMVDEWIATAGDDGAAVIEAYRAAQ